MDIENESTIYIRDDSMTAHVSSSSMTQSFIFGVDHYNQDGSGGPYTNEKLRRASSLTDPLDPAANYDRGKDDDNMFDVNDHDVGDEPEYMIPIHAQAESHTHWGMVIRHWILSSLFLPLYTLGLVTYTWKNNPKQLSLLHGVVVIGISTIFYGLLWASFGLTVAYPEIRDFFPGQECLFVFFIYFMCCFAESMLKNTYITSSNDDDSNSFDRSSSAHDGETIAPELRILQTSRFTTVKGKTWTIQTFLETILFVAHPTTRQVRIVNFVGAALTLFYTAFVIILHLYFILINTTKDITVNGAVIAYICIETILQTSLCFMISYPLGQVALRLWVRDKVAKVFSATTGAHSGHSSHAAGLEGGGGGQDFSFRLVSLRNIKAWQIIRETLLRRYAFPSLYVDVVISAAFTLWIPLVSIGFMDFFFRSIITPLAFNTIALALIILVYLLICVIIASSVQQSLSNTDILRKQELQSLLSPGPSVHSGPIGSRGEGHGGAPPLTGILKRLAELIDAGKESAVVFQVWGFPLNQKMATFLGGVLLTLASSVVVRAASKIPL